jgi:hypothetical protein
VQGQNTKFEEFVFLKYIKVWEHKFRALGLIPSYKTMLEWKKSEKIDIICNRFTNSKYIGCADDTARYEDNTAVT